MKKEITFRVEIDCCNINNEVQEEMSDREIGTHYEGSSFSIDWDDQDDMPQTQAWLIKTHGEEIMDYDSFVTIPT